MDRMLRFGDILLDLPAKEDLRKWDCGVLKESGRKPVKFLWVEEYTQDFGNCRYERHCHLLECSSRGTVTLDGKRVEDGNLKALFDLF